MKQQTEKIANKKITIENLAKMVQGGFNDLRVDLGGRIDGVEKSIGGLGGRMDRLERRMNSMEDRLDSIEARLASLENRMIAFEDEVNEIRGQLADNVSQVEFLALQRRVELLEEKLIYKK